MPLVDTVNFTESVYAVPSGDGPTSIAWAPDGTNRLFWTKQDGTVRIVKNGAHVATPFATMSPIRSGGEEGLLSIAFDPSFIDNQFVYVFVTSAFGKGEILRYRATGDIGVERTVLLTDLPQSGNHNGGGIAFGPDGKLYWGIGEAGANVPLTDTATLNSKIGRMHSDGGAPIDNPFFDGPGPNNDYIWARGFRNPYTMTFQPSTEKLWVNVVGTSAEQIFLVNRNDHGGYVRNSAPTEGSQVAPYIQPVLNYWDTPEILTIAAGGAVRSGGIVTITTTTPHAFHKPGCRVTLAGIADASFNSAPPHPPILSVISPTQFTIAQAGPDATSGGGTSRVEEIGRVVLGGTFYDATSFPPAYRGNYFWGDFSSGRVMRAVMGGPTENKFALVDPFSTGITNHIDAAVGPDGALYWARYDGTFYRVAYNATAQGIVVSNQHVRMAEGGRAIVTASLAIAPTGPVSVNVARTAGDADLTVSGGAVLTFGPADWNIPQSVTFSAAADGDATDDSATFTAGSAGLPPETVTVRATDGTTFAIADGGAPDAAVSDAGVRDGGSTPDAGVTDAAITFDASAASDASLGGEAGVNGATPADSDSGCSCRTGRPATTSGGAVLTMILGGLAFGARRRRIRSS